MGGADEVLQQLQDGSFHEAVKSARDRGALALPEDVGRLFSTRGSDRKPQPDASSSDEGPSQLHQLAVAMREGLTMEHHKEEASHRIRERRSFSFRDGVQWLLENRKELCPSEMHAVNILADLQGSQMLTIPNESLVADHQSSGRISAETPLSEELLVSHPGLSLQWVHWLPHPTKLGQPLNVHFRWFGSSRAAVEVSSDLRRLALKLYDAHMTRDGKRIDYEAMERDDAFDAFVNATAELQKVDVYGLDRAEALSFWINIYNALIVHAMAVFGVGKNPLARLTWFDKVRYEIGGRVYSANDIEHGVLRGNKPSPASPFSLLGLSSLASPTFRSPDPRRSLAMQPVDPRIHFALNCGAGK